jgi:hypothetical protein
MHNYCAIAAMGAPLALTLGVQPAQPPLAAGCTVGLSGALLGASLLSSVLVGAVFGFVGGRVGLTRIQAHAAMATPLAGRHGRQVDADYFETLQRESTARGESER